MEQKRGLLHNLLGRHQSQQYQGRGFLSFQELKSKLPDSGEFLVMSARAVNKFLRATIGENLYRISALIPYFLLASKPHYNYNLRENLDLIIIVSLIHKREHPKPSKPIGLITAVQQHQPH